jgi:hypothetical protein
MELRDLNVSCVVATSAGLGGIWQPQHFTHVTGLEAWEDDVAEDAALEAHIRAGAFVPLNVGGDGAFQTVLRGRTGTAGTLTPRERRYLLVTSEPYLLVSGGLLEVGGLEAVGGYGGAPAARLDLAPGRYAVVVHLVDWEAEDGAVAADGSPKEGALPDFVVEIGPELPPGTVYRHSVETFDPPAEDDAP